MTEAATAVPSVPEPSAAPDFATFGREVAPQSQRHRAVRRLFDVLSRVDPRASREAREETMIDLAYWVRLGGDVPVGDGALAPTRSQHKRVALLVTALEMFPYFRERVSKLLQVVLLEHSGLSLLARVGIPGDRGLFSETVDRLSRGLMPQPVDEEDLTQLLARMFPSRVDEYWLGDIQPALVAWFARVVRSPVTGDGARPLSEPSNPSLPDTPLGAMPSLPDVRLSAPPTSRSYSVWAPLRGAALDAILLLASRVSSAGLTDAIRARSPKCPLRESPFFRLPRSIDAFLATPRHDLEGASAWADECRAIVIECREAWNEVLSRLESQGVSVDMVYRLELIDRSLGRIDLLLELLVPQKPEDAAGKAARLASHLLHERRRDRSLTDIVRTNTRLLARKIIERAGQTGEHYITATPREYVMMLLSAGGGGILTAGTAAAKFFVGGLHRPLFQEGLLSGINYAGSFLLMQALGFTLATKQPSVTAASLAGSIKAGGNQDELVATIARVTRSQLAAALGNVGMVIPACLALDKVWRSTHGAPFLDAEQAKHMVESLQPIESGTVGYAALTGVLLWMSSIAAGWLENWAVYRRLPEAIAEHRVGRLLGKRVTRWASRAFSRNIAGVGGNTTLGFMLAMTPIIGKFVGAPLDVRHVTLSTGALTLSICNLGTASLSSHEVQAAMVGIGIIGALNFGVSFFFALTLAARARDVSIWQLARLLFALLVGFVTSPFRFFLPVERGATPAQHH
jgi:site-specific recombinase